MAGLRRLLYFCLILSLILSAPEALAQQPNRSAGNAAIAPIAPPKLPPLPPGEGPPVAPSPAPPRSPPIIPGPGFRHLVNSAGIIFSGRVISIGHDRRFGESNGRSAMEEERLHSSAGENTASTEITFLVEHALRGAVAGQRLTIHEWAGKWGGGPDQGKNYFVGQRLMLFLYSPSKLGLTSPVSGSAGRFAVDSRERIVLSALHRRLFADDPLFAGRDVVAYREIERAIQPIGEVQGGHE